MNYWNLDLEEQRVWSAVSRCRVLSVTGCLDALHIGSSELLGVLRGAMMAEQGFDEARAQSGFRLYLHGLVHLPTACAHKIQVTASQIKALNLAALDNPDRTPNEHDDKKGFQNRA